MEPFVLRAILGWRHQCRRKTLIWQKDRTQKNVSRIFLRSMFLPIQVDLFGPSRFPQTRNRQENGGKNIFPALHFHAPIFLPIPNRTTSHPRFLACSIRQVDGTICSSTIICLRRSSFFCLKLRLLGARWGGSGLIRSSCPSLSTSPCWPSPSPEYPVRREDQVESHR